MKFHYQNNTIEFDQRRLFAGNPVLPATKVASDGTLYYSEPNLAYTADSAVICAYRKGAAHA